MHAHIGPSPPLISAIWPGPRAVVPATAGRRPLIGGLDNKGDDTHYEPLMALAATSRVSVLCACSLCLHRGTSLGDAGQDLTSVAGPFELTR
jgi:hypothetical protein